MKLNTIFFVCLINNIENWTWTKTTAEHIKLGPSTWTKTLSKQIKKQNPTFGLSSLFFLPTKNQVRSASLSTQKSLFLSTYFSSSNRWLSTRWPKSWFFSRWCLLLTMCSWVSEAKTLAGTSPTTCTKRYLEKGFPLSETTMEYGEERTLS